MKQEILIMEILFGYYRVRRRRMGTLEIMKVRVYQKSVAKTHLNSVLAGL